MLGVDVDPTLRLFRERHPEVGLRLQCLRWWNQELRTWVPAVELPVGHLGGLEVQASR
jgi:hypothetical protein